MQLTGIDRLFWVLSFCFDIALLAVLIFRRRAPYLRVFTAYFTFDALRTILLYFIYRFGSALYFNTYWTLAFVDLTLQFSIAYEIIAHIFQPLGVWADDVRRTFFTLVGVSLAIALGLTLLAAPVTKDLRSAIIIRGNFFCSALLSELFVVMIVLSVTLGLPWRTHIARVAQGFSFFAFFGIVTDGAHSYFGLAKGVAAYHVLSLTQIGCWLLCMLYWIVTLAIDEPKPRKLPEQLHADLRALQARASLMLSSLRAMGSTS